MFFCEKCQNTGGTEPGGDLDCTAPGCNAAAKRAEFNKWLLQMGWPEGRMKEWQIYRQAQRDTQEEVDNLQCRLELADMRINALVRAKGEAERRLFDSTQAALQRISDFGQLQDAPSASTVTWKCATCGATSADICIANGCAACEQDEPAPSAPAEQAQGQAAIPVCPMCNGATVIGTPGEACPGCSTPSARRLNDAIQALALRAVSGEAKPAVPAQTGMPAVTVDTPDWDELLQSYRMGEIGRSHVIDLINHWQCAHIARAVAEALKQERAENDGAVRLITERMVKAERTLAADQQPDSERYYMDHNQLHDRVTGQHLWTQDQYDERYSDGLSIGRANAILEQPDSERDAARYRMMKENDFSSEYSDYITDCLNECERADLDAIIDAKLSATPQTREG